VAGDGSHRSHTSRPQREGTAPPALARPDDDSEVGAALEEIQRVLDTPLAELMGTEEERGEAAELTRQAVAVPALARLREVVAFVGRGRPATQAGNLKPADAVALAKRLAREHVPGEVRSIEDLPDAARAFHWAAAAEFLAWRGSKIVAGPSARDLEHDPLSAWLKAAITLLDQGMLDGFRQGWRKHYVELLDASAPGLLAAIVEAGGRVPLTTIEDQGWELVAGSCGYELDDDDERLHAVHLIRAMAAELADIGIIARCDDEVVLTGLGSVLAIAAAVSADEDLDDLDLVNRAS
jgi:hypothetical protein